jgi:hypothetical protein
MENIDTGTHKWGDVEFTWVPGALGISDLVMVDPDGKCGVDTLKAQSELVADVLGGQAERRHVAAAFIVIDRDAGWVNWEGEVEIGVMGPLAVALELPHARDSDRLPWTARARRQVIGLVQVEVDGTFQGRLGEMEQPFPGEQLALGARDIA